ncbi:MAG: hypothetical protein L6R40_001588 [Gallowayella cf. fulva]|nr:MAG: hypothetical protein L6R40_001588 [Xanthomendoza cf. fulva]
MANLTLDPHYCDSYSECSSSNTSFSHGILTPTCSTGFSAATSRRQSIASESQSYSENRAPTFSRDGLTTPLRTPPPCRLGFRADYSFLLGVQGYDVESPPTETQNQRVTEVSSTSFGPQSQNGFGSQGPYYCAIDIQGLDGDFLDAGQHSEDIETGLISAPKQLMDFAMTFNPTFDQAYDQNESTERNGTFDFDSSGTLDFGYVDNGLPSPTFVNFGVVPSPSAETEMPQTVAPQKMFVDAGPSFIAPQPMCQASTPPYQTPWIKTEDRTCRSSVDSTVSSVGSLKEEDSPCRRRLSIHEHQAFGDPPTTSPARTRSNGIRKRAKSSGKFHDSKVINGIVCGVVGGIGHKKHRCEDCNAGFLRPEHHKRHVKSLEHIKQLKKKGVTAAQLREMKVPVDDTKPYKCVVPACIEKGIGVTRQDNLKPHYQKTHLYRLKERNKEGKLVKVRKRNEYVSPKEAEALGLAHIDPRTKHGRRCLELPETSEEELSDDTDD